MKPRDKSCAPGCRASWRGSRALLMFFPIFWMVLASFKTESQAIETPPVFFFAPTLENYQRHLQPRRLPAVCAATASSSRWPPRRSCW